MKRIGIATGNTITATTQPLTTIDAHKGEPVWAQLDALMKEWRPDMLVVGLPLMMDGSEEKMAVASRKFGDTIARRYNLCVDWIDERLSSSEADHLLREAEADRTSSTRRTKSLRSKRVQQRDSLAAELILRTYMASKI